jgi:hypothetical protein
MHLLDCGGGGGAAGAGKRKKGIGVCGIQTGPLGVRLIRGLKRGKGGKL